MDRALIAACALFFFYPTSARAQDDLGAARDHFVRGSRAFDLGHYDEAVHEYDAAYRAKDDPAFLFDLAQAYRKLGKASEALRAYKTFLQRMPSGPNSAIARGYVVELTQTVEAQRRHNEELQQPKSRPAGETTVLVTSLPAVSPDVAKRNRRFTIAGLSTAAAGLGLLAVGGGLVAGARTANDDITASGRFDAGAEDRRDTFQTLDVAFFVAGGVAVVAGTTLVVLGRHHARPLVAK